MLRFDRKTPKTQEADKSPYTCYNPHTTGTTTDILPNLLQLWGPVIRIISIDPGISNFCIRVEERGITADCNHIPKTLLYDKLHLKKIEQQLTEQFECLYYKVLTNFLETHWDIFKTCHLVIVERQMPFNYKATRIAQHILTYFMLRLQDLPQYPIILEIDSKLKTKGLNAAKTLNDRGIKLWSVDKAHELLNLRQDTTALAMLKQHKKKQDDLADTVCQIESLCLYFGWPSTQDLVASYKAPLRLKILPSKSGVPLGNAKILPKGTKLTLRLPNKPL